MFSESEGGRPSQGRMTRRGRAELSTNLGWQAYTLDVMAGGIRGKRRGSVRDISDDEILRYTNNAEKRLHVTRYVFVCNSINRWASTS